jgi:hypothetical protein
MVIADGDVAHWRFSFAELWVRSYVSCDYNVCVRVTTYRCRSELDVLDYAPAQPGESGENDPQAYLATNIGCMVFRLSSSFRRARVPKCSAYALGRHSSEGEGLLIRQIFSPPNTDLIGSFESLACEFSKLSIRHVHVKRVNCSTLDQLPCRERTAPLLIC